MVSLSIQIQHAKQQKCNVQESVKYVIMPYPRTLKPLKNLCIYAINRAIVKKKRFQKKIFRFSHIITESDPSTIAACLSNDHY
jgi:hypothetical protein